MYASCLDVLAGVSPYCEPYGIHSTNLDTYHLIRAPYELDNNNYDAFLPHHWSVVSDTRGSSTPPCDCCLLPRLPNRHSLAPAGTY